VQAAIERSSSKSDSPNITGYFAVSLLARKLLYISTSEAYLRSIFDRYDSEQYIDRKCPVGIDGILRIPAQVTT
jgi:hypothetical protein